jgi:hypothetical protein
VGDLSIKGFFRGCGQVGEMHQSLRQARFDKDRVSKLVCKGSDSLQASSRSRQRPNERTHFSVCVWEELVWFNDRPVIRTAIYPIDLGFLPRKKCRELDRLVVAVCCQWRIPWCACRTWIGNHPVGPNPIVEPGG